MIAHEITITPDEDTRQHLVAIYGPDFMSKPEAQRLMLVEEVRKLRQRLAAQS
jgi:hypothetical protein